MHLLTWVVFDLIGFVPNTLYIHVRVRILSLLSLFGEAYVQQCSGLMIKFQINTHLTYVKTLCND
jgi:hypothetical protein